MRPLLVAVCILVSSAVAQNHFDPNGDPFHNFEQATAFDKKCQSNTGSAAANSGSSAQNTTKNNFSAALPATDITIDDLASLQRQVATKIPESSNWGRNREPHDRTPLQRLSGKFHEGMAVRLTAYVFESHYADLDGGESVNCKIGTREGKAARVVSKSTARSSNDIHVALASNPGETNELQSVTAEVIPHFRPDNWNTAAFPKGKLVRVTGQLMYDASHNVPPRNSDPKRQSLWEVHPVYRLEQCNTDDGHGGCTGTWTDVGGSVSQARRSH